MEKHLVFGIQGGRGSFNEEAVQKYIRDEGISPVKIRYLYTTEQVLSALSRGEIDYGQFAIRNSLGGVVEESIVAMERYKFRVVKEFSIRISHALMIRGDAHLSEITTVMTHPQVLAQCKQTLAERFPDLRQTSGKGELMDSAKAAEFLSAGKLPNSTAVMGSKILAEIYGLVVVADNLQDMKGNWTSFLIVER